MNEPLTMTQLIIGVMVAQVLFEIFHQVLSIIIRHIRMSRIEGVIKLTDEDKETLKAWLGDRTKELK